MEKLKWLYGNVKEIFLINFEVNKLEILIVQNESLEKSDIANWFFLHVVMNNINQVFNFALEFV